MQILRCITLFLKLCGSPEKFAGLLEATGLKLGDERILLKRKVSIAALQLMR